MNMNGIDGVEITCFVLWAILGERWNIESKERVNTIETGECYDNVHVLILYTNINNISSRFSRNSEANASEFHW